MPRRGVTITLNNQLDIDSMTYINRRPIHLATIFPIEFTHDDFANQFHSSIDFNGVDITDEFHSLTHFTNRFHSSTTFPCDDFIDRCQNIENVVIFYWSF